MTMARELATRLGRRDQARPSVRAGGRGDTLAALEGSAAIGPARTRAGFSIETGTVSATMLGGIVVGLFAFYLWTRGHQG